jgi:hypothetical protein
MQNRGRSESEAAFDPHHWKMKFGGRFHPFGRDGTLFDRIGSGIRMQCIGIPIEFATIVRLERRLREGGVARVQSAAEETEERNVDPIGCAARNASTN